MLEAAFAQLRFAASITFGWRFSPRSLDRIIDALLASRHEFGVIGAEAAEMLSGPALDAETQREMQIRRFRTQAKRALETDYYERLFAQHNIDPTWLRWEQIEQLSATTKAAFGADGVAFVRRGAKPVFRSTTTGTTGQPTSMWFSAYEMHTYIATAAIGLLWSQQVGPDDVVQISTSARAALGNTCFAGACTRIGALVHMPGLIDPVDTLALLHETRHLPGKQDRVSVLLTYPSYLGELVECGLQLGYRPADFGVERIFVGGELVTAGLKARAHELFGPVQYVEGYGMTEAWPFGATLCPDNHLHWDAATGLLEVQSLTSGERAQPGEAGTLVLTPFPSYRETTILLRYNTEDVVRTLDTPPQCHLRHVPATSNLLGKLRLATRGEDGWTFPRQVLEALEAVADVPLPARCGFWAVPGGVAVEVVARADSGEVRRRIERSLIERGVPVQQLHIVGDRSELQRPLPLRSDLRETTFGIQSNTTPRSTSHTDSGFTVEPKGA